MPLELCLVLTIYSVTRHMLHGLGAHKQSDWAAARKYVATVGGENDKLQPGQARDCINMLLQSFKKRGRNLFSRVNYLNPSVVTATV